MNSSHVMTGIEMPGSTADNKGLMTVGVTKAGKNPAQAIISDFKKKLESLATAGQPAAVVQGTVILSGQDHSMATNAAAQMMPQEVAGILEGFGLLDYQADISAVSTETGQPQMGDVENPDVAAGQQAQMSDQFARMLHREQPGEAAQQAQPQTNAGAEEYSGSLESTNSRAAAGVPAEGQDAATLLKSKLTAEGQPQETVLAAQQGVTPKAAPTEAAQAAPAGAAQAAAADVAQAAPAEAAQAVPAEAARTEAVKAAPMEAPQEAAGEAPPDKKAETLTAAAADASPEPVVNAGTEAPAARAQQAEAPMETAEPQKTTSDFVKDNVIRIVDKASVSVREGRYEFEVELKPDFLGKVSIKLTMENGEVRMHVHTEDAAVKGLFSDQSASLQSALKEKGIVISTVDVSYQDPMTAGREAFGQQAGGNGQRREGQLGWSSERYTGNDLFDATTPAAELLGGSSVEYLA